MLAGALELSEFASLRNPLGIRAPVRPEGHGPRFGLVRPRDRPQPVNRLNASPRGGTGVSLAHDMAPFPKRNFNPEVGRGIKLLPPQRAAYLARYSKVYRRNGRRT